MFRNKRTFEQNSFAYFNSNKHLILLDNFTRINILCILDFSNILKKNGFYFVFLSINKWYNLIYFVNNGLACFVVYAYILYRVFQLCVVYDMYRSYVILKREIFLVVIYFVSRYNDKCDKKCNMIRKYYSIKNVMFRLHLFGASCLHMKTYNFFICNWHLEKIKVISSLCIFVFYWSVLGHKFRRSHA